jgi:sporulation protein YlmC with PRC-barrel domain
MTRNIIRTKDVIGVEVRNAQNEKLGEIDEIVLDKLSGEVRYLVLSFGGLLGMGDKLFAIPWNAICYDNQEDCFILNLSKERLKDAPGFNKDQWPDMADMNWSEAIFNFYGTMPYWQRKKAA